MKGAFSRVKTGGTRSRARQRSASRDEGDRGDRGREDAAAQREKPGACQKQGG